jgi:hypothetical protein
VFECTYPTQKVFHRTLLTELASEKWIRNVWGVSTVLFSISTKRGVRTQYPNCGSPPDAKRTSPVSWLPIRFHLSERLVSRLITHGARMLTMRGVLIRGESEEALVSGETPW